MRRFALVDGIAALFLAPWWPAFTLRPMRRLHRMLYVEDILADRPKDAQEDAASG
jgi:hypothetical protein